jgi:hypothetical protein
MEKAQIIRRKRLAPKCRKKPRSEKACRQWLSLQKKGGKDRRVARSEMPTNAEILKVKCKTETIRLCSILMKRAFNIELLAYLVGSKL